MKNRIVMVSETKAEVSKAFAKKARIFGSEEYKLWMAYRQEHPKAKMEIKEIKSKKGKQTYKGLSYGKMEEIIKERKPELLGKFESLKKSPFEKNAYHATRAWFVAEIPDYKEYIPQQQETQEKRGQVTKVA